MMGITLYGFWSAYYGGVTPGTLSVFLGGLDCGDYTVQTDGSITVPYGSDPDGILTAAYLQSISSQTAYGALTTALDVTISSALVRVYVPLVVGYNYVSAGETVRPLTTVDDQSPKPYAPGKTRRVHMFGALLQGAIGNPLGLVNATQTTPSGPQPLGGLQFRSGSVNSTWFPAQLRYLNEAPYNYETLYNGVHWDTIDGDENLDGVVSWQMTRPYPVTVCSIAAYIETAER